MRIVVIDGQGGGFGRALIEKLRAAGCRQEIIAVGTNDAHMQKLLLCLIGPAQAGRHGLQQRRKQAQHHLEQALEQRGAARVV